VTYEKQPQGMVSWLLGRERRERAIERPGFEHKIGDATCITDENDSVLTVDRWELEIDQNKETVVARPSFLNVQLTYNFTRQLQRSVGKLPCRVVRIESHLDSQLTYQPRCCCCDGREGDFVYPSEAAAALRAAADAIEATAATVTVD
jgi:hypothetical protein